MGKVDLLGFLEFLWEAVSHYLLMGPSYCKKICFPYVNVSQLVYTLESPGEMFSFLKKMQYYF